MCVYILMYFAFPRNQRQSTARDSGLAEFVDPVSIRVSIEVTLQA